eukprot:2793551-Rhodomonas_salina.1
MRGEKRGEERGEERGGGARHVSADDRDAVQPGRSPERDVELRAVGVGPACQCGAGRVSSGARGRAFPPHGGHFQRKRAEERGPKSGTRDRVASSVCSRTADACLGFRSEHAKQAGTRREIKSSASNSVSGASCTETLAPCIWFHCRIMRERCVRAFHVAVRELIPSRGHPQHAFVVVMPAPLQILVLQCASVSDTVCSGLVQTHTRSPYTVCGYALAGLRSLHAHLERTTVDRRQSLTDVLALPGTVLRSQCKTFAVSVQKRRIERA